MKKLILITLSIFLVSCSTFGFEVSDKNVRYFDMNSIEDLLAIHEIRGYPPLITKLDEDSIHVKHFCAYRLASLKILAERGKIQWGLNMKTIEMGYFIPKDDPETKVLVCLDDKIADELALEICAKIGMRLDSISDNHEKFICKKRLI